jgi:hypothetical protein
MEITFSSDGGKTNKKDWQEVGKIAEAYFKTHEDPEQAQITEERAAWIRKEFPECLNLMKSENKVIGVTFVLPCTNELMNQFLSKEINEEDLFVQIQNKMNYDNLETIYLCSAIVIPEFRRKGLALQGTIKSIEKILEKRNIRPTLFYWAYSKEGLSLAKRVAKALNLECKKRG